MFLKSVPDSLYHRAPVDEDADVRLRYLGTAGFVVEGAGHTIVLDPFITRPGLRETVFKPLVPDERRIAQVIPHADDVVIGHAHHDHVLDAPCLCRQTGARFIGSPDACNVARAAGLSASQIVETRGREAIATGPGTLRGLPSEHGRVYFNRVSLPGDIPEPPPWPARVTDLRHGLVLNWHIELAGVRIVHIDTAEFFADEMQGLKADVLCLCAIGRKYRPNYVAEAVALLEPKIVVACHWDWFFTPYEAEPKCLPGVDLPGFVEEIIDAGAEAVVLPFDGVLGLHS
ncbi:MBL fold metallo-hydrolase [Persicimonas caeni]|uniref:MBL fold metallo-hydrolase n=1 Tax=Persicimonas caeni TaxID=2292766 RepID=A0A4Y6PRW4_PERCE|nr:MBL fold metallo-hydrolase [Persicimonas caeni]QDG50525.1 MBL fold metallo-hydrolase [Persicimonas caeni]QED31746.1 MBL fold metallo-hydrolase [Persicimonas caeni]